MQRFFYGVLTTTLLAASSAYGASAPQLPGLNIFAEAPVIEIKTPDENLSGYN